MQISFLTSRRGPSRTGTNAVSQGESAVSEHTIKTLDRNYRDPRGIPVHVTGWDRERDQVIFMRPNYPHECMQPVWKFQQFFKRVEV
ncbi:DUF4222 domain-containing protein [Pantoea sp. BAV 3049]|uniref:DUF4222 domain-containing protein n=1 Tax=Pantoea sp. BAV 3049 TaxID=2654188 RepID=UPI00131D503E